MYQLSPPSRVPTSIEFQVLCHTQFGQELRICGSTHEFGNWNPLLAHKLFTDNTIYPMWKSVVPVAIGDHSLIEFKACIIANNTIAWERNIENRHLTPQTPSFVEFAFNQPGLKIINKKVTEIECRQGTWDILREMQGSESSIDFKSNYPIQSYFMRSRKSLEFTRQITCSESSNNLFSPKQKGSEQQLEQSKSIYDLDKYTIKCQQVKKVASSFKPILVKTGIQTHLRLNVENQQRKRKRSRSRGDEKSESVSQKKLQEAATPYLIHVPSIEHIQDKPKSKVIVNFTGDELDKQIQHKQLIDEVIQTKTEKEISRKSIKNSCKSKKQCATLFGDHENNSDTNSTSTITEYETEDEYINSRDCDVVIQNSNSFEADDI